MADAWLPGAVRLPSRHDGGPPRGGAPRAVWHTSENDPLAISARSVAQRLEQGGRNAHVVWNPVTGEILQMVPATQAARLLPGDVGREGRRCLQIVVVGFAREPFTDGPMKGIAPIVDWLGGWQVARRWPAGRPLPPPEAYDGDRNRRSWARGGHFGASQVPHGNSPAPGAVDIGRITGLGVPRIASDEMTLSADEEELRIAGLMPDPPPPPPEPARARASSPT